MDIIRLSGLTIGIVTATREEAVDLIKETLQEDYNIKNEWRSNYSIDIYRDNMIRVVWIQEGVYKRRGYRFNTVYCREPVRNTEWFRSNVQPKIINYSYILSGKDSVERNG